MRLRCRKTGPKGSEPGWKSLDTAALCVWLKAGQNKDTRKDLFVARAVGKRLTWRPAAGEIFSWNLILLADNPVLAETLVSAATEHFADPRYNFEVLDVDSPEIRSVGVIAAEHGSVAAALRAGVEAELVLDFMMPLAFRAEEGRSRNHVRARHLADIMADRVRRIAGIALDAELLAAGWESLPYYWDTVVAHRTSSTTACLDTIGGCEGPLVLKGNLSRIIPVILFCSESCIGEDPKAQERPGSGIKQQVKYSGGYFEIVDEPFLPCARRIEDSRVFRSAIAAILERRDDADGELTGETGFAADTDDFIASLMREIQSGLYSPAPFKAFAVPKRSGGMRIIEKAKLRDLVVQTALQSVVTPILERAFEESSTGFRPHRSRETAFDMIKTAVLQGYGWVAETDIRDFFPTVDHARLRKTLAGILPAGEARLVELIMTCVSAPCEFNGRILDRTVGIPQGSPLSPVLANLYLDKLDENFLAVDVRFVRYADDFVILAKTEDAARAALESGRAILSTLGLKIKEDKTAVKSVDEGFEFLGIRFGDGPIDFFDRDIPFAKPLYITTPWSFLTVADDTFELRANKTVVGSVPIRRVSDIVILERSVISTQCISRCMRESIPISITLGTGYHVCTIKRDSRKDFGLAWRHGQKYYSLTDGERLGLAKEIAQSKILNYRTLFSGRRIAVGQLEFLESALVSIASASDCDVIRGLEGSAARNSFRIIDSLILNPDFRLQKRGREVRDRVNSLLNYGYYLLFTRINSLVRACGLDPYLGILHSGDDRYESLVCDLEEGFRPHIDRYILRMINTSVVTAASFEETERGFYLKPEARKLFLQAWEGELQGKARKNGLTVREAMEVQVRIVKTWIEGSTGISFYRWDP